MPRLTTSSSRHRRHRGPLRRALTVLAVLCTTLAATAIISATTQVEAWGGGRSTPQTPPPAKKSKERLHTNFGIVPAEDKGKRNTVSSIVRPASRPLLYPVHPRVNINWTETSLQSDAMKTQRKAIEQSKLLLTKLIVVNRHGHRAPNKPYWEMCPNDISSRRRYDVDSEDLSALGMQEEYDFGSYLRHTYHSFLGDRFNRSLHYLRAVGETRILQSAMAVAQGVFPDGFGPGGFLPSRPQFVPVFSDMDTHEYLLDDVPCFRRAEADSRQWITENYDAFVNDPYVRKTLQSMTDICGKYNGNASGFAYVKTVADGLIFNSDLRKKVAGGRLTREKLFHIRNISMHLLMQRLYNTDEQQTYTVVDLPSSILRLLNHTHIAQDAAVNDFQDTRHESTFFFVHRESLYALAQFFGWRYKIAGLPLGEVPVASSLIIEKLVPKQDDQISNPDRVYVRLSLWTPYDGKYTLPVPTCEIPELCLLSELRAIFLARNARTGDWKKLCDYVPMELDHTTDIR